MRTRDRDPWRACFDTRFIYIGLHDVASFHTDASPLLSSVLQSAASCMYTYVTALLGVTQLGHRCVREPRSVTSVPVACRRVRLPRALRRGHPTREFSEKKCINVKSKGKCIKSKRKKLTAPGIQDKGASRKKFRNEGENCENDYTNVVRIFWEVT